MSEIIKDVVINQTAQDVVTSVGWPAGTVVTIQNKSSATLCLTQNTAQPDTSKDFIVLQPNESATTEQGDLILWVWSPSNAKAALIKRS